MGTPALFCVGLMFAAAGASLLAAQGQNNPTVYEGSPGGPRLLEEGQPPAHVHATVEEVEKMKRATEGDAHSKARPQGSKPTRNLTYRGGTGGIGVEMAPKVYIVLWGSQWVGNDPSGETAILTSFYNGAGGSTWLNSVIQYCQGVAIGTTFCNGTGTAAGNQPNMLVGVWSDNATAAPSKPSQSQFAAEAVRAAQHFGNTSGGSNANAQYVIATATGNNSSGFGLQYCAYHSSTNSAVGSVAYTNLPYMTDAGASCGANFNGLGAKAGITIVAGHEMAESITDPFPSSGWVDSSGAENADKCSWISSGQGAAANVTLSTGSFPVQSLWSNTFSSGAGGCVLTFP